MSKKLLRRLIFDGVILSCLLVSLVASGDPLDNWRSRTSGTTSLLSGIVYGNSTFVAVGYGGTILTSPDGTSWETQNSRTTIHLCGITYENNTFVAVGYGGEDAGGNPIYSTILTSPDGKTWTPQTVGTTAYLEGVTYGNSTFVAVGYVNGNPLSATILTSPDGKTWTPQSSTIGNDLCDIAYGNSRFVVVGSEGYFLINGVIETSPDGVTWTPQSSEGNMSKLLGITYGNSTFVAVGYYGYNEVILTSPDGVTWTPQTVDTVGYLEGVTYGNSSGFVAVGDGGTILTSPDGTSWETQNSGTTIHLWGITYGNNTFVAVGDVGTILQSDPVNNFDQRIGKAIKWASDQIGQEYENYGCLEFVKHAYTDTEDDIKFVSGLEPPWVTAQSFANKLQEVGRLFTAGVPPCGAYVFYSWGTDGHVGLSLGDGQIIHCWTFTPDENTPSIKENRVFLEDYLSDHIIGPTVSYIGWALPPLDPAISYATPIQAENKSTTATVIASIGSLLSTSSFIPPVPPPTGKTLIGLELNLNGFTIGDLATFLIDFSNLPSNVTFYKFNPNTNFYTNISSLISRPGNGTLISFPVADGGPYDYDQASNGSIYDPLVITVNTLPNTPANSNPSNGTTGLSLTPTLQASTFSDPDTGDTHKASQWQIRTATGSYSSPVYDSGTDTVNKTSITIPSGSLGYLESYFWRVCYQDSNDAWSDWSDETSFTTTSAPSGGGGGGGGGGPVGPLAAGISALLGWWKRRKQK